MQTVSLGRPTQGVLSFHCRGCSSARRARIATPICSPSSADELRPPGRPFRALAATHHREYPPVSASKECANQAERAERNEARLPRQYLASVNVQQFSFWRRG